MSEDHGALSRWSQRKAAARRGEMPAEPSEQPAPQAITPIDDTAILEQGGAAADDTPALPPVEELTAESDYTAFLGEKVPEHLRRAALRKLWSSDPVLANLDGLNHYDEDYNLIDTTISAAQTAYRAGLGYIENIETTLEEVENALDAPRVKQIESAGASVGQQDDASSVSHSGAGDKSVDAPQQQTPSSEPSEPR